MTRSGAAPTQLQTYKKREEGRGGGWESEYEDGREAWMKEGREGGAYLGLGAFQVPGADGGEDVDRGDAAWSEEGGVGVGVNKREVGEEKERGREGGREGRTYRVARRC